MMTATSILNTTTHTGTSSNIHNADDGFQATSHHQEPSSSSSSSFMMMQKKHSAAEDSVVQGSGSEMFPLGSMLFEGLIHSSSMNNTAATNVPEQTSSSSTCCFNTIGSTFPPPLSSSHRNNNNTCFHDHDSSSSSSNILDRLSVLQGILSSTATTAEDDDDDIALQGITPSPYPSSYSSDGQQVQQHQQNFNESSTSIFTSMNDESIVIDIDDLLGDEDSSDEVFNKDTAFDLLDEDLVEPSPILSTPSPRAAASTFADDTTILMDIMEPTPLSIPSSTPSILITAPPSPPTSSSDERMIFPLEVVSSSSSSVSSSKDKNNKKRGLEQQQSHDDEAPQPSPSSSKKQRRCSHNSSSMEAAVKVPNFSDDPLTAGARFRVYQADQWSDKFAELCQFIQIHGHCQVPRDYNNHNDGSSSSCNNDNKNQLSRWLKRQRYQYKLLSEKKPSTMTQDRIKALEALPGFVWNSHIATWEERYGELVVFMKSKGHCNVPSIYGENQKLATWVKCQRRQMKLYQSSGSHIKAKSNMTPSRIAKLNSIGFQWELRCMSNSNSQSSTNKKSSNKQRSST